MIHVTLKLLSELAIHKDKKKKYLLQYKWELRNIDIPEAVMIQWKYLQIVKLPLS